MSVQIIADTAEELLALLRGLGSGEYSFQHEADNVTTVIQEGGSDGSDRSDGESDEDENLTPEEIAELREEFGNEEEAELPPPSAPAPGKIKVEELSAKRQRLLSEAKTALDGSVPAGVGGLIVVLTDQGWSTNKIASLLKVQWADVSSAASRENARIYPRVAQAYEQIKHLF